MTCDDCGHDLPSDARFCPACGTAVTDTAGAPDALAGASPPADPPVPAEAADPDPGSPADPAVADADPAADAADASDLADPDATDTDPDASPGEEPPPAGDRGKRTPVTVLGNILAVAAGGALGVLAGMAIRQVM